MSNTLRVAIDDVLALVKERGLTNSEAFDCFMNAVATMAAEAHETREEAAEFLRGAFDAVIEDVRNPGAVN